MQATKTRIGVNVNAATHGNTTDLVNWIVSSGMAGAVIMDGSWLADGLQRQMPADALLIDRGYKHEDESYLYQYPDQQPQAFVQRLANIRQEINNPALIYYTINEPGFGTGNARASNIENYVKWEVDVCKLARQHGLTLVAGNLAVGKINQTDVNAGLFDPLLSAVQEYGHYLGVHEYTTAWLPTGFGVQSPYDLLEPLYVLPESGRWPTKEQIHEAISQTAMNARHLLRSWAFQLRAWQLGLGDLRMIVTEGFWDYMGDIAPILKPLKDNYSMAAFDHDLRGVNTYFDLWQFWFDGMAHEDIAMMQLDFVDRVYPDQYKLFTLFTVNQNPHWRAFDISYSNPNNPPHINEANRRLWALMQQHVSPQFSNKDEPKNTMKTYQLAHAIAKHPAGANLRKEPGIDSDRHRVTLPPTVTQVYLAPVDSVYADGYQWLPIKPYSDNPEIEAWVASEVIEWRYAAESIPLPGESFDLAAYMFATNGKPYQLKNTWAGSIEWVTNHNWQRIKDGVPVGVGGVMEVRKNQHREFYAATDSGVFQLLDTSYGDGKFYVTYNAAGEIGMKWCNRMVTLGTYYKSESYTEVYNLADFSVVSPRSSQPDVWYHVPVKVHRAYVMPSGQVVRNVLEIHDYIQPPAPGVSPIEKKFYAYGAELSLVGWLGSIGSSWYNGAYDEIPVEEQKIPDTLPPTLTLGSFPVWQDQGIAKHNADVLLLDSPEEPEEPNPPEEPEEPNPPEEPEEPNPPTPGAALPPIIAAVLAGVVLFLLVVSFALAAYYNNITMTATTTPTPQMTIESGQETPTQENWLTATPAQ